MIKSFHALRPLALALFGALLFAGPVTSWAQEVAQTQPMEKIEVTGTAIRRTDTETPSPVQVITADEMKKSGYTTVSEVLNSITANNQGTLSQGFSGAFATGASGVALRGLTVGATLVLIDGHRMAPYPLGDDGQRSFVDLSSLPFDAVDHIEVVKDSASALYGSDAIAGVVNVILKKTYKGGSVSAETGWANQSGGKTNRVSAIYGFGDLDADGQNMFFNVEYRHQDPILVSDRPSIRRADYTNEGGQNLAFGSYNPAHVGTPMSTTGYFIDPNSTSTAPYGNFVFLPGCNLAALTANKCLVNPTWLQVIPETENLNLFGRFTRKLGGDWELSLAASMFQSKDVVVPNYIGPFSTQTTPLTPAPIGPALGVSPGPNGPIVHQFQLSGPYLAPVPASLAGQFAGGVAPGTLEPIQITLADLGPAVSHATTQTYRLVGDLKGSVLNWDVNATYGWTAAINEVVDYGDPNYQRLYQVLANGTYHPGLAASHNNPAIYNYIAPPIDSSFKDYLWFANLHTSRDLFNLWGGPVGFASGVDFFYRNMDSVPSSQTTNAVQPSTASTFFAIGTQNDVSVFGELNIPVIKALELDVSGRYDHYNTYGSSTTPKAGFKFKPIDQVLVRGTYAKGFRAPNPIESGNSAAVGFFTVFNDPILCPNSASATSPGNFPSQCGLQSTNVTTGTPGIQPETSVSYTAGLVLEPVRQVSASADFFDIKLSNQIVSGLGVTGVTQTLNRGTPAQEQYVCAAADVGVVPGCAAVGQQVLRTTPVGLFAYFSTPYVNLNSTHVRGIDFGLNTKFDLSEWGKVTTELMWSHLLEYLYTTPGGTVDLAGTHGPSVISGDTATPRNRAKFILAWESGPYSVTGTMNYTGPYSVVDPSLATSTDCVGSLNNTFTVGGPAFPGGTTPPSKYCTVSSFTDFDLYLRWNPDKHWSLHSTIRNVFNRAPPVDLQSYGSFNFNPSLHMDGAIGRFFDFGASYSW